MGKVEWKHFQGIFPLLFVVAVLLPGEIGAQHPAQQPRPGVPGGVPQFDKVATQLLDYAATHPQEAAGFAKTDQGCPIPSLTASHAVGQRGHLLLDDVYLVNELASFNRERIPERVVFAKGFGAFGFFQLTTDLSTLTKADFLNGVLKSTRVLVRFSRATGNLGSPDMIRDCRGFSVRFYTVDGNMDLVGNTNDVFPIRDPMQFVDMVRSRKLNPQTHLEDATMRWDFDSLRPETILYTLKTFSDYGANSRVVNGHGVHAFKFVNAVGHHYYVKFHLISQQPFRWFNATELEIVSGQSPDYATKDLYNKIANGNFPKWTVKIQVMTEAQALTYPGGNPFDVTINWKESDYPLMAIGELILNENPQNYFVDIEEAAFSAANLVPGIEPNPKDKMFHARIFAYPDAHRYRLGSNYAKLEVNRPKFLVRNYHKDGRMRPVPNGGGGPDYFPNSFHGPSVNASAMESTYHIQGIVDRVDRYLDVEENFRQARTYLYSEFNQEKRRRVAQNLGMSLAKAIPRVRAKAIQELFSRISDDFGKEVWIATQQTLANP